MAAKKLILGLKTAFIWCTFSIQRVKQFYSPILRSLQRRETTLSIDERRKQVTSVQTS